jgi:hypothetical protein
MVFNATFNNISVRSWQSALLVEKPTEHGAWWFRWLSCGTSNLNGKYLNKATSSHYDARGIVWWSWKRNSNSIKKTYKPDAV